MSPDRRPVAEDAPRVYELYGLRVCSDMALPAAVSQSALPPYDLEVRWGECRPLPDDPPAGCVLATLTLGNGRGYTVTDTTTGYTLRFHQTCEFAIGHDLRAVRVHLFPDVHPDMAGLLLVGNVLACLLTFAGEAVLHASAVGIGNAALACVGGSGMGKSTLAALLCARGARYITDDLLRLQPTGQGFRCFPGPGEIRLRQGAAALAAHFPATVRGTTPDERIALKLVADRSMPLLSAIVIPRPSRRCHVVRLERLPRSQALLALMRYPKIQGFQQRQRLQHQFEAFAPIAARVPLFEAEIPWGPPFALEIATALVRGVGLPLPEEVLQ